MTHCRLIGISIVLAVIVFPAQTSAQSVDDCMTAERTDALTLCKRILDNGSRNSNVYWKLASAQFQEGQQVLADRTLADALRLHPGNPKLMSLKKIIESATTEQELIARSAELNQRSMDQGALKISCLIKSGAEAIAACKRRMELTDDDGDRMRARLAELESQQPPTTIATAPAVTLPKPASEPKPKTPAIAVDAPDPVVKPPAKAPGTNIAVLPPVADTQTDTDPLLAANEAARLAAEARKEAYKALVAEVQTRLNGLGYPAGVPDGVPGNKTRTALRNFYTAVDAPVITSISDITLEDITDAQRKLANAKQILTQSETALEQGNRALAAQKLAEAQSISQLLNIPAELELALQEPQVIATAPSTIEKPQGIQSQTVENTADGESQQFADLMDRINILYGQIKRDEEDQALRLKQVRDIL